MTFKRDDGAYALEKRYSFLTMCSAHLCVNTGTKTASEPLTSTLLILGASSTFIFILAPVS